MIVSFFEIRVEKRRYIHIFICSLALNERNKASALYFEVFKAAFNDKDCCKISICLMKELRYY